MPGTKAKEIDSRAPDVQAVLQAPFFQSFNKDGQRFIALSYSPVNENSLRKMLDSPLYRESRLALPIALGYDLTGEMFFDDLKEMPHAMYVGATNSGKSTGLITMILSLICKYPADKIDLVICDIGANTLGLFEGIPHLSHPIVKDRETAAYVIQSLVDEMNRRVSLGKPDLADYSEIILVMDEFPSFISGFKNKSLHEEVKCNISDLLCRGCKENIHVILATQEHRTDLLEVAINNITSRMTFKVASFHASNVILNGGGAEKLPGKGAMLYISKKHPEPLFIQGAYISTDEAKQLITHIKDTNQDATGKFVIPEYCQSDLCAQAENDAVSTIPTRKEEKELAVIIMWTLEQKTISAEKVKKQYEMGNRANEIVERVYSMGIISKKFAKQPRTVLPESISDLPAEVIDLLNRNGITNSDIEDAINRRKTDDD